MTEGVLYIKVWLAVQGKMAKESEVLLQPGHKWNNIVFYNHTGLKTYPNYMMGGGYVVSGDVAQTIMNVNRKMQLKFTPIEDATMGFWLMSMVCTLFLSQSSPQRNPAKQVASYCIDNLLNRTCGTLIIPASTLGRRHAVSRPQ